MRELKTTASGAAVLSSSPVASAGFSPAPALCRTQGRVQMRMCEGRSQGRLGSDRPVLPGETPPLGAHVVTPRRGYIHHGIYVGRGKVVQYGGLVQGLRRGPVEEVSLAQFTNGRPLSVRCKEVPCFGPDEVIHRARSRVGEHSYRILTNNCEHFSEWCLRGEHRSYQVEEWLARPYRVLQITTRWVHGATAILLTAVQTLPLLRNVPS